jgi:hypothetical protein
MKVTVNMKPEIKALLAEASKADSRSISGLIEILAREYAPRIIEGRKGLKSQQQASA